MGPSWFVRPDTRRLTLSDEQWIVVKARLTTGEYRAHMRRSSYVDTDGLRRIHALEHGLSLVVAYLVDWSLPDVSIRGVSEADLTAALDNLVPDRFMEIKAAIETHEAAMTAEREAAKNVTDGATNGSAISPSPSALAGPWSGSVTSTSMTMPSSSTS